MVSPSGRAAAKGFLRASLRISRGFPFSARNTPKGCPRVVTASITSATGGLGSHSAGHGDLGTTTTLVVDPEFTENDGRETSGGLSREAPFLRRMKLAHLRGDDRQAGRLLAEASARGVVNDRLYGLALSVFSSRKRWRMVVATFDDLRAAGVKRDLKAYNAAIMACSNCNDADRAAELFREMPAAGLVPEVYTYTALIFAYGYQGRSEEAIEVFEEMRDSGIAPDERAYRAAIDACGIGLRWEKAVQLLREMPAVGITPGDLSYRAAIMACRKGENWYEPRELSRACRAHWLFDRRRGNGIEDCFSQSVVIRYPVPKHRSFCCRETGSWCMVVRSWDWKHVGK